LILLYTAVSKDTEWASSDEEETVGSVFRKILILAAPFVWRKYKERRRKNG
jgi:hypothetical protein